MRLQAKTHNLCCATHPSMELKDLNTDERAVLECLDAHSSTWGEYCIAFDYIMGETNLDRKTVSKACRSLKAKELAEFYRGLMTEDGEVAGSGYCITREGQLLLRSCIDCKENPSDMTDGRCQECWNMRRCLKCGKPYKDHPLVNGYPQEFEFTN